MDEWYHRRMRPVGSPLRGMSLCFLAVLVGWMGGGCGCRKEEPARAVRPVVKIDPAKPEDTLYEQLRAGSLQIAGVIETLGAAADKLGTVDAGKDAEFKAALQDLREAIDAAGADLSNHTDEPSRERLGKVFPEYDEKRIRAIAAANDALHEIAEASGIATDLANGRKVDTLNDVADLLDLAVEDLKGSIEALGGKVEE